MERRTATSGAFHPNSRTLSFKHWHFVTRGAIHFWHYTSVKCLLTIIQSHTATEEVHVWDQPQDKEYSGLFWEIVGKTEFVSFFFWLCFNQWLLPLLALFFLKIIKTDRSVGQCKIDWLWQDQEVKVLRCSFINTFFFSDTFFWTYNCEVFMVSHCHWFHLPTGRRQTMKRRKPQIKAWYVSERLLNKCIWTNLIVWKQEAGPCCQTVMWDEERQWNLESAQPRGGDLNLGILTVSFGPNPGWYLKYDNLFQKSGSERQI